jgi:hypothetical protein
LKNDKDTLLDYAKDAMEKQQTIDQLVKTLELTKAQQEG